MHKVKVIFFIVVLLPNIALANVYVKIGESKSRYGLQYAYKKLKQMNMKMSYTTLMRNGRRVYAIFSGPYTTPRTQTIALNNSRIFFKQAKLVKFSQKNIESKKNVDNKDDADNRKNNSLKYDENMFAGFGLGYASAPSSHEIETGTVSIVKPNNDGGTLLLYAGYKYSEKISFLINYLRVDAKDLIFDNFYATIDYTIYKARNISSNLGLSIGGTTLSWNHTPLEEANKPSDNNSESWMYGLELKFLYEGYKKLNPFMQYHGIIMEHTTNLTQDVGNTSKLQHKILHNILFGLEYKF